MNLNSDFGARAAVHAAPWTGRRRPSSEWSGECSNSIRRETTRLTDRRPQFADDKSASDKALKRSLSRAESIVRIQLPPAGSPLRT